MDFETQLVTWLVHKGAEVLREKPWGGWLAAAVILHLYRRTRYLTEALRRANEESLKAQNETWRTAFEIFTRAPPPKLSDLANDTEWESPLR